MSNVQQHICIRYNHVCMCVLLYIIWCQINHENIIKYLEVIKVKGNHTCRYHMTLMTNYLHRPV